MTWKRRPASYRTTFIATFRPGRGWSDAITRHEGTRCLWRRLWIIGEGPFAGEWACVPVGRMAVQHAGRMHAGPAWAPESELVERGERADDWNEAAAAAA